MSNPQTHRAGIPAPTRSVTRCSHCGETVERLAEDNESVLLIGKGMRFNLRKGTLAWNCKKCGSENTISLFTESMTKALRIGQTAEYNPRRTYSAPER